MHADNRTEVCQILAADTPEGRNIAVKLSIVSDSGRKCGEDRGLGLWSRKRHRQEVRARQNSLEMLYHHYMQGTVSHHEHKKLWGLSVCAFVGVCVCVCI